MKPALVRFTGVAAGLRKRGFIGAPVTPRERDNEPAGFIMVSLGTFTRLPSPPIGGDGIPGQLQRPAVGHTDTGMVSLGHRAMPQIAFAAIATGARPALAA